MVGAVLATRRDRHHREAGLATEPSDALGEFDVVALLNVLDRCDRPVSLLEAARDRLAEESGGDAVLGSLTEVLGVGERELTAIARRRAYVDAFLRANLEGNTVVSDSQVERAFETGEHPFVGRELDEVREVMRVWLARQVYDRDVARWIEVLRSRARVRVLVDWSDDEG